MGRGAECTCRRDKIAHVKVLLEPGELILRGGVRRRIAFQDMRKLHVKGRELCFTVGDELLSLALGSAEAAKWAEIIGTPSPGTRKDDILAPRSMQTPGTGDRETIFALLKIAAPVSGTEHSLIVAHIATPEALVAALEKSSKRLAKGMTIWIIYPRGRSPQPSQSEHLVRKSGSTCSKVTAIYPRPHLHDESLI